MAVAMTITISSASPEFCFCLQPMIHVPTFHTAFAQINLIRVGGDLVVSWS